jgi:hypothetical protein
MKQTFQQTPFYSSEWNTTVNRNSCQVSSTASGRLPKVIRKMIPEQLMKCHKAKKTLSEEDRHSHWIINQNWRTVHAVGTAVISSSKNKMSPTSVKSEEIVFVVAYDVHRMTVADKSTSRGKCNTSALQKCSLVHCAPKTLRSYPVEQYEPWQSRYCRWFYKKKWVGRTLPLPFSSDMSSPDLIF